MDRTALSYLCALLLCACGTSDGEKDPSSAGDPRAIDDSHAATHDAQTASRDTRDADKTEEHDDATTKREVADAGRRDSAEAVTPTDSAAVTYYQHVKPILDAKCVRCHVEGTVAPFSLAGYAKAKGFAKPSLAAVQSGHMPPWKFDDGCSEYQGNYQLTDQEKLQLAAWVEQGTLEGDASKPAQALDIDDTGLSRVDLTLTLPEPYTPKQRPDEYRCFPVSWPKDKTTFMTGFRPSPGAAKIVHHIEVYHVPAAQVATVRSLDERDPGPGYTCFGGPGTGLGTIGGWAPGMFGYDYPAGIGIQIDPGAVIVVQVHYNTSSAEPEPDQSKVDLKLDDQAIKGGYNFWMNSRWSAGRQMSIPAGDADVKHTWTADPTSLASGKPMVLYTAAIHMHNLGKTGYMKLKRKGGGDECMLRISDWDFHWQGGVRFKKPLLVQPGDQIEMQCGFDNSAANQPLGADDKPVLPRDVNWGEGTSDEMCLGILLWGPQQ